MVSLSLNALLAQFNEASCSQHPTSQSVCRQFVRTRQCPILVCVSRSEVSLSTDKFLACHSNTQHQHCFAASKGLPAIKPKGSLLLLGWLAGWEEMERTRRHARVNWLRGLHVVQRKICLC